MHQVTTQTSYAPRESHSAYEAAALAGLGLIQAPFLGISRYLESGALVRSCPTLIVGRSPCRWSWHIGAISRAESEHS
jgi:hypothetical protein